jgi:hypothetical protein
LVVSADGESAEEMIHIQKTAYPPRDHVIRAGCITAQSEAAHKFLSWGIHCKTAAKHIHATDLLSHERIVSLAEVRRRSFIRRGDVYRIAFLQTEQTSSRLYRCIKVRRRKRQTNRRRQWRKRCSRTANG